MSPLVRHKFMGTPFTRVPGPLHPSVFAMNTNPVLDGGAFLLRLGAV